MKNLWKAFLALTIVFAFTACSDDDDSNNTTAEGSASVLIKMVDAPGDYDAVFVDVEDIVVKYSDEENEVSVGNVNAGVYNLLELTGGNSALLFDDDLPAGTVSQIRLILGEDNSVVVDGQTYPLATPSAQQSGLKLQLNQTLEDELLYDITLDFDVENSIVVQGNGDYSLKPVINASLFSETGQINGMVQPSSVQTLVTATSTSGDVEVSTYTDANGNFLLEGLPAGTYDVTFEVDPDLGVPPITVEGVEVSVGLITPITNIVFDL